MYNGGWGNRSNFVKQFLNSKRWLATLTMFTLMWTGTLWHDFFGLEVMPLISKSVNALQEQDRFQSSRVEKATALYDGQTEAGQQPCSCPTHVHSPSCLAKIYHCAASSILLAVVHVLAASIMPDLSPPSKLVPSRDPPRIITKKCGAALYLAKHSLLI